MILKRWFIGRNPLDEIIHNGAQTNEGKLAAVAVQVTPRSKIAQKMLGATLLAEIPQQSRIDTQQDELVIWYITKANPRVRAAKVTAFDVGIFQEQPRPGMLFGVATFSYSGRV